MYISGSYIMSIHLVSYCGIGRTICTCLELLGGLIVKAWIILAWLETRSESPFILECAEQKITQKNTKEDLNPDEHLEHKSALLLLEIVRWPDDGSWKTCNWRCLRRSQMIRCIQNQVFWEYSLEYFVQGVFIRILRSRSIRCMDNILWACKPIGRAIVWRAPDARNATSYRAHQSFPMSTNINLLFSVCHLTIHQTQKKTHQDHRQFPLGYSPPAD